MINKLGYSAVAAVLCLGGCGDNLTPPGTQGTPDGGGDAQAALVTASVDSSQLADVPVGSRQAFQVTITNAGPGVATLGTLTDAALGVAAPFSVAAGGTCASGAPLAVGASCTLMMAYAPTSLGASAGTLHLPYVDSADRSATLALAGSAKAFTFTSGQAASVVIGQADFVSNSYDSTATTLSGPWGDPSFYNGELYVTDWDNSRIFGYHGIPATNGPAADFVLGQTDFTSNSPGTTGSTFRYPWSSSGGEGVFAVADTSNNRVLLFAPIPTTTAPAASVVLGQAGFDVSTSGCAAGSLAAPSAAVIGGGKLVVADYSNNRVLIWNSLPSATTAPDLVLGQSDFSTCTSNTGGVSATSLYKPGDVWTNGTSLIVADAGNHRMLIWRTFPTANDQPADVVLGQATFAGASANQGASISASGFDASSSRWSNVTSNGVQIFYSDYHNNRILIWNQFPTDNGTAADIVIGQADMTSKTAPSPPTASSVSGVGGVTFYGHQFIVTDYGNNRVLIFDGQ